ncbi:UNVERIFIED_CONTAM: hypothetical protein FKN15_004904, partial [Acipenser sinensis]
DCSNLARKRLFKAESEIQLLKSQITKEKVLWEGRFQELRRKQRELKEQLRSEVQMRTGTLSKEEINDIGFDRFAVNTADKDEVDIATDEGSPRSSSKPNRVFVPHSHLDLRIGHKVRVLLPLGRINTGIVHFLGYLNGMQDFCLGVELETPDKPGHGVFVSFNKLLMAWE